MTVSPMNPIIPLPVSAVETGATFILTKETTIVVDPGSDELAAIGQVLAGATYIHPGVASGVVRQLRRALSQDGLLSEREHELLCLAARGLSNPQIAREMVLSQNTVKTHLQAIYRKLGVRDRNEAVLEAVERKLLPESALRRGRPRG